MSMSRGSTNHEGIECDTTSCEDLKHVCDEARDTIDTQIEKIKEEETKAVKITRLNLILFGIIASVITVKINQEAAPELLNIPTIFGTTALLLSTLLSAMGYTSSVSSFGVSEDAIADVRDQETTGWSYYCNLSDQYESWMEKNDRVHKANSYAITWSLSLVMSGIILYITGIFIIIMNIESNLLRGTIMVASFIVCVVFTILFHHSSKIFGFFFNYSS